MMLGADPALIGREGTETERAPVTEMGLAVSLAFDATTWAAVGVSSPPARAASQLVRRGHYRLELLQLVLIAKDSGGRLLDLTAKRAKGASLRSLAEAGGLEYDAVYAGAERLAVEVDRRLRENARVRSDAGPAPAETEGPAPDPAPKPKKSGRKRRKK